MKKKWMKEKNKSFQKNQKMKIIEMKKLRNKTEIKRQKNEKNETKIKLIIK